MHACVYVCVCARMRACALVCDHPVDVCVMYVLSSVQAAIRVCVYVHVCV